MSNPGNDAQPYEIRIEEDILTDEAAADLLKCHLKSLQKELREGKLKGTKRMGKWYILKSDLIDYIRSGKGADEKDEENINV
jgi:hypothetical protein